MFGGFFGLNAKQKIFLELCMIAPILLPPLCLNFIDDALFALFFYQVICGGILPFCYINYLSKEKDISPYFFNELRESNKQIGIGFRGIFVSLSITILTFLFYYWLSISTILNMHLPIILHPIYLILLLFLMLFVSPVMEEWLWRIFLPKTLENTPNNRDWINMHYGIYHFYAIFHLIGLKTAFIFTMTYLSFGRSMQFMKEKYGFISCVLTHMGFSLGVGACFFWVICLKGDNLKDEQLEKVIRTVPVILRNGTGLII